MAQRKTTLGRGVPRLARQTEKLFTVRFSGNLLNPEISLKPITAKSKLKVSHRQTGIAASRAMKKFGITNPAQKQEIHKILQAWASGWMNDNKEVVETSRHLLVQKLHDYGFDGGKVREFHDYFLTTMKRLSSRMIEELKEKHLARR